MSRDPSEHLSEHTFKTTLEAARLHARDVEASLCRDRDALVRFNANYIARLELLVALAELRASTEGSSLKDRLTLAQHTAFRASPAAA